MSSVNEDYRSKPPKKKRKTSSQFEKQENSNISNGMNDTHKNESNNDTPELQSSKKKKTLSSNDVQDTNICNLENVENCHKGIDFDKTIDKRQFRNKKEKKLKKHSEGRVSDPSNGQLKTNKQNSFTEATVNNTMGISNDSQLKSKLLSKKKNKHKNKFRKHKIEFKINDSTNSNDVPSTKETVCKKDKAIAYLEKWKNDKDNWKFEKLTQFWLLKNMFNSEVPEETFQILLEYLIYLRGAAKNFAVELCENVLKSMEEKSLTGEKDQVLEYSYHRARSVLQYLQ